MVHWKTVMVSAGAIAIAVGACASRPEASTPVKPTGQVQPTGELKVWKQSGFEAFSKGRFGDGGHNTYVSAKGRIQLVNRWDLNSDGHLDLVFANSHPQAEKLDAALYWGNGKDFDDRRVSMIPNEGAQHSATADLDGDGRLDLVVPNYANGTWSKMPSAVYYGSDINKAVGGRKAGDKPAATKPSGKPVGEAWNVPPFARKTLLPTEAAQAAAVGDLNRDGHLDLVFAQSAGFWEYRGGSALASPIKIYWGSTEGYTAKNFLDLEAAGASAVAIADLDGDEWPDLVVANRENAGKSDTDSFVYYGGEKGFSPQRRTGLPTHQVNATAVADVNGDGMADILFANGKGSASFIYLNDKAGFNASRRIELPTSDARGCAAADLNQDGLVDLFFTNHQTSGNRLTLSYLYWGGAKGFSADKRQEFETVGAWGVSLADLNEDGRIDIVVSNFQEHYSFEVPSYIYWNSPGGFSNALRTSLFTHGAIGNTAADFNGDGHPDLLFNNTMSRRRGGVTPSFLYWGNDQGAFSVSRRLDLPGVEPYDWASGDLNDDGMPDLILANMAEVGRRISESFIYWGGAAPAIFTPDRRSALVANGARGVSLGDLDRDGYLDVILFNTTPAQPGVIIYWGAADGFVTMQRTELPGGGNGLPTIADLNYDGHLDLIVPGGKEATIIYRGDGTRRYSTERRMEVPGTAGVNNSAGVSISPGVSNSEVADMNRDGHLDLILTRRGTDTSYIYYGNAAGEFSEQRRSYFKALETQGVTIGDINKDGWLDIVAPAYKDGGSRATMSTVFLGGPEGIDDSRSFQLPTNGGTGSQIADYNRDGYNDLLLVCHRAEGDANKVGAVSDHTTDSYLYWGGPDGLRADRKLLIPSEGTHYDSGVDLGNVYNRGFQFDYISSTHQFGQAKGAKIEWNAITPPGTKVRFQIRTASSEKELSDASWLGPKGAKSYYESSGAPLNTPAGHSWIQYRAVLESSNGGNSPVVDSVSLSFR